jgi:hypothetical protein
MIPFQNCSLYKSEGRKAFESSVAIAEDKGCYPYIDTNIAMQIIGATEGSLNVYKERVSGEDAYTCDFRTTNHLLNHINCKVSQGNAELAFLLKQNGASAFEGTVAIWSSSVRSGFVGTIHGGYITLDSDEMYTIKYLALDGNEQMGVGCAVRVSTADYAANTDQIEDTLSQMTFEMAIQNQE